MAEASKSMTATVRHRKSGKRIFSDSISMFLIYALLIILGAAILQYLLPFLWTLKTCASGRDPALRGLLGLLASGSVCSAPPKRPRALADGPMRGFLHIGRAEPTVFRY